MSHTQTSYMPRNNSIKTITDPLLEPYFIIKDDYCFTVNERIIPNGDHFRSKRGGTEYCKAQGYYPNLKQALLKIINEKIFTEGDTKSLEELINRLLRIETEIKEYINGSKI